MRFLRLLFCPITPELPPKKKPDMRKITASLALGNINIQKGRYATREDIDALARGVADYNFDQH